MVCGSCTNRLANLPPSAEDEGKPAELAAQVIVRRSNTRRVVTFFSSGEAELTKGLYGFFVYVTRWKLCYCSLLEQSSIALAGLSTWGAAPSQIPLWVVMWP